MRRKILLIEPNYSNKYPPIGLMKIATYHRILGDNIIFFKGNLQDFLAEELTKECITYLEKIDNTMDWSLYFIPLKQYLKTKKSAYIGNLNIDKSNYSLLIYARLDEYADIIKKRQIQRYPKFDRIYVTTLFTFYWKITVETIQFCKKLIHNQNEILIGGVLASLLHAELEKEVGIKPLQGLLDKAGMLDPDNLLAKDIIIDNLPLDYSILDEIDYQYPTQSAYFTFMTKGCTRKCAFCSVPILEPTYKPKIETIDKFLEIKDRFGEQQNLLLMDNNVLASPKFLEIVDEIKAMGFVKGATYVEPNQLDIAIKNLAEGYNDYAFIRRTHRILQTMLMRLKGKDEDIYYNVLADYKLLKLETTTKENILNAYPLIKDIYEKRRNKASKLRYVDFNQGTDCRYVTPEIMKKMAEIPIRPLRIAFDYIGIKKQYINAVKLAAENDIKQLSNYILYNFQDKPADLYERLKINTDLCLELNIEIFSFPMKYIPLFGEDAKDRKFTGKHWNPKFIRAVQSILNVSKGIVAPSHNNQKSSFFEVAFGKNVKEFFEILYMPETFIIYRHIFRYKLRLTEIWEQQYRSLSAEDRHLAHVIIERNIFTNEEINKYDPSLQVRELLCHYQIKRDAVQKDDPEFKIIKTEYLKRKKEFNTLIKDDQFIDLTLTYDFS